MKTTTTRAIVVLIIAMLLGGCSKNPFSTRASEDPRSTGGTYTDPISADIALENLFYAYNERNLGNLSRGLANDFMFAFDFLNIDQPGGTTAWEETEETRIADNLFRAIDTLILNWSVSQTNIEDDSSATYYRIYEITVVTTDSIADTTIYSGESVFYLHVTESARWEVYHWDDRHRPGEQYSWADLKSRYR